MRYFFYNERMLGAGKAHRLPPDDALPLSSTLSPVFLSNLGLMAIYPLHYYFSAFSDPAEVLKSMTADFGSEVSLLYH